MFRFPRISISSVSWLSLRIAWKTSNSPPRLPPRRPKAVPACSCPTSRIAPSCDSPRSGGNWRSGRRSGASRTMTPRPLLAPPPPPPPFCCPLRRTPARRRTRWRLRPLRPALARRRRHHRCGTGCTANSVCPNRWPISLRMSGVRADPCPVGLSWTAEDFAVVWGILVNRFTRRLCRGTHTSYWWILHFCFYFWADREVENQRYRASSWVWDLTLLLFAVRAVSNFHNGLRPLWTRVRTIEIAVFARRPFFGFRLNERKLFRRHLEVLIRGNFSSILVSLIIIAQISLLFVMIFISYSNTRSCKKNSRSPFVRACLLKALDVLHLDVKRLYIDMALIMWMITKNSFILALPPHLFWMNEHF